MTKGTTSERSTKRPAAKKTDSVAPAKQARRTKLAADKPKVRSSVSTGATRVRRVRVSEQPSNSKRVQVKTPESKRVRSTVHRSTARTTGTKAAVQQGARRLRAAAGQVAGHQDHGLTIDDLYRPLPGAPERPIIEPSFQDPVLSVKSLMIVLLYTLFWVVVAFGVGYLVHG